MRIYSRTCFHVLVITRKIGNFIGALRIYLQCDVLKIKAVGFSFADADGSGTEILMEENACPKIKIISVNSKHPFFACGRLVLVLRMSLPCMEEGGGLLEKRFNSFYESIKAEYIRLSEEYAKGHANLTRPAVLKVNFEIMTTKVDEIKLSRSAELRSDAVSRRAEYIDCFDSLTGLMKREKKEKKQRKLNKLKKQKA